MKIVLLPTSILGWQLSVILLTPEKKKKNVSISRWRGKYGK